MLTIAKFARAELTFAPTTRVDAVAFTAPDGTVTRRPAFEHQPAKLTYNVQGYESVEAIDQPVLAVRFTPTCTGRYSWAAFAGTTQVQDGSLTCTDSDHPGYVQRSSRDPRYFAMTDGSSYCPIGANVCWPVRYALSTGQEFLTAADGGTLGINEYRRWFDKLATHGGNFARIWLSNSYFNATPKHADQLDLLQFHRSDALIDLARSRGIRLKHCFDNMRGFDARQPQQIDLVDQHGQRPDGPRMDQWFTDPRWQGYWWTKVHAYLARYGDDPTVMAWELWNEINACKVNFDIAHQWTIRTLETLAPLVPRQMVVNSLGSFDSDGHVAPYAAFGAIDAMDFQQVHRYLDQGARLALVRQDPVAFSVDAVKRVARPDRPTLLAETGAVNDHHTGPFRYYPHDDQGIIFADTTYPAFFAGAAGSGHIWHWDRYVDQKNLWDGYAPLAELVAGIQLDAQAFEPVDLSNSAAWALALRGRTCTLLWVRNRADSWDKVLQQQTPAPSIEAMSLPLAALTKDAGRVDLCRGWRETVGPARIIDNRLHLPSFRRMLFVRLQHA